MTLQQTFSSLALTCPTHVDEPLNLFCQSQELHKGLICCICETQIEDQETILPLRVLIQALESDIKQIDTNKSSVEMAARIDYQYHRCQDLIETIKNQFQAESLKDSIRHYFKKLGGMLLKPKAKDLLKIIKDSKNRAISIPELNEFFMSYCTLYKVNKKAQQGSNHITRLVSLIDDLPLKYSELEKQILANANSQILHQIYFFSLGPEIITYFFSPQFKNACHTITDTTTVTQMNNYNTNYCLIEPSIQGAYKYDSSIKTVKIKISKLTSWISIGLVHGNIAKTANYYFNTGSVGHGAYMISNDGYTWHHHTSSLNSFYNSFSFQQGDTVVMTVNPKTKVLKFFKQTNPDHSYELNFQLSAGDKLYFAVSLSSHQEEVKIINNDNKQ